jgi:hypothetical protein
MSSNTSHGWTIDDIVIGNSAASWLRGRSLLPSSWGLKNEVAERIKDAVIRLTIMYSPASILKLQPNPLKDLIVANLVIIDANAFEHPDFTREESIATMLHEIGHVFHDLKPKPSVLDALKTSHYVAPMNTKAESENAADDFACEVGYGKHVASGLKTLTRIMPDKFDNDEVKARIKRMEERS